MNAYCDIETDGYLENCTRIHCLVIKYKETVYKYREANMVEGCKHLQKLTEGGVSLVFHNGLKFDVPVLKKIYPWLQVDEARIVDTLVMSRVMFPNLFDTDPALIRAGKLQPNMIGRHSLEAWGQRVGVHKKGYEGGFEIWAPEMEDYCVDDVLALEAIHKFFLTKNYSPQCLELEHKVATIIARQERRGFSIDLKAASELYAMLSKERMTVEKDLRVTFPPFYLKEGREPFVPKIDSKKLGYCKEAPVTKVKLTEFNPGSRDHISIRLRSMRGWKPTEFTNDGKAKIDDSVLGQLPYPEAKLLARYMMLNKRIGQVAEGDQAWLKVQRDGVIYGSVITNGAVTGRMTHAHPNLAQVPAVYSPYGSECRALFKPRKGMVLVGADASALELRCLAGYMASYDAGAYIKVVVDGKKEDGTEIHTVNRKALGIDSRDVAKTWFYGFIYGAGNEKLGTILGAPKGAQAVRMGKSSRDKFFKGLPALGTLVDRVQNRVKTVGFLKGLDGRILHVRSSHSALNTLLQSAGAILMKQALVYLDSNLKETLVPGVDYEFLANIHDEWQIECLPQHAEHIGKTCVKALQLAGEHFEFACSITGEYVIGNTWKETH